jgi:ubiquitin-protein ligase
MGVHELRLEAEHKAMKEFRSRVVNWTCVGYNDPPDTYRFTYQLRSIVGFDGGKPVYGNRHEVKVRFPSDYPRRPPNVELVSRPYALHPNIYSSGRVCIEDRWRPVGMYLDTVCELVGQLLAYQKMNTQSPANSDPELMAWVEANSHRPDLIPTDKAQIRLPDPVSSIVWGTEHKAPRRRIEW